MKKILLVLVIFILAGCNGNDGGEEIQSDSSRAVLFDASGKLTPIDSPPRIKNTIIGGTGGDSGSTGSFNTCCPDDILHTTGDRSLKTGWLAGSMPDTFKFIDYGLTMDTLTRIIKLKDNYYCDTINWKAKYDSLLKQKEPMPRVIEGL